MIKLIDSKLNELGNDPAILSQNENIDPGLVSYFLKIGAAQPLSGKQFPKDHNGRSFHESWYWQTRSTGEVSQRKWLSYSIKNHKIYCLYCALFARNNKQNWTKYGFSNWNKGTISIIIHETSEAHIMALIKAAYRQAEYPLIQSMKESGITNIAFNKEIFGRSQGYQQQGNFPRFREMEYCLGKKGTFNQKS
ncbi:zinc finger MYM-type protein 1-like [Aphis craccivora]|uniref:Zinc finger MYM-type protein 1-like n=1 Tax=Aphis craccivora TaxID=307492 RepID=A0A6G0Y233_APHCR|nr:zinc finger MYM-type protein 1-like [Aphis craccivora]